MTEKQTANPAQDVQDVTNAFCELNPRLKQALHARLERRLVNLISYAVYINKPLYLGMASAQQEPELAILAKLLCEYNFALTWHKSGHDTLVFLEPQRPLAPFAGATVRAVPAASVPATFTVTHHADNDAYKPRDHRDRSVASIPKGDAVNLDAVNPEAGNPEAVNYEKAV